MTCFPTGSKVKLCSPLVAILDLGTKITNSVEDHYVFIPA